jgi:hypothetical protein
MQQRQTGATASMDFRHRAMKSDRQELPLPLAGFRHKAIKPAYGVATVNRLIVPKKIT